MDEFFEYSITLQSLSIEEQVLANLEKSKSWMSLELISNSQGYEVGLLPKRLYQT